jgi:serine/threonine-protein kinase
MASVFLCEDERLNRRVAVKRLHPYSTADDEAARFAREARLGASLNHPGLVSVFDTVPDDDGNLIVMEYVPGETLGDALKRGPLASRRAIEVIGAVASALDHAHAHGVLHRDVKPGNILLRDDGVVKLADLGIATAAEQTRITSSGTVLGTAAYMAPEQLEGSEAEPRSDVYALATVAFEAFGGRKARPGATPLEVAHQIAAGPPPDLREAWPEAPAAVANVLARGMARRPQDRPATPGELAGELERALETPMEEPTVSLAPTPILAPSPRPRSPRWLPAAALAVTLLAAVAVVAIGGGDSDEGGTLGDDGRPSGDAPAKPRPQGKQPGDERRQVAPAESPAAEPQPAESQPTGANGAALNAEGFELMQDGRYDEAIPILEQAVAAFPQGTTDLNYAYALYNLGRSLRLAGRPDEAVPILERRLRIPNQSATVRRELQAARSSSTNP